MRTTIVICSSSMPLLQACLLVSCLLSVTHGRSLVFSRVHGNEERSPRERRSSEGFAENPLKYLMHFGYLPSSDLETGNLRSEEDVKNAIRTMQSFAGIPVTGKLDDATKQLMRTPRCALPDITSDEYRSRRSTEFTDSNSTTLSLGNRRRHENQWRRSKRYTVQGQKWKTTNLTYSVREPYTRQMDVGQVRLQVDRALKLWSEVSQLNFREINSDAADIKISFHTRYHNDGYPFDGKGTLLAHAFFPGSGIGGDAHFDEEEHWLPYVEEDGPGLSFYAVAAHEFGHSLGLSHSSVHGAIMYPYYQNIKSDYKLSDDDVRGIQHLYGPRNKDRPDWQPTNPPPVWTTPSKKPIVPTKPPLVPTKYPTPTKAPTARPPAPTKPDACDTSYDAISIFRNELFIFKDKYFWRIGDAGSGKKHLFPVEIGRFWYGLPLNLTHVDAVYQRADKELVIFIGKQYWIYQDNQKHRGPFPLTQLGLPVQLDKLDGAMVWGHNGKTYFFSGTMYWRFDEEAQKVELDYPRDMSMWKGVPYNIDSVFQWKDGKTYFFKGKVFWKFDNRRMRVESFTPSLIAPFWMGCPSNQMQVELEDSQEGPETEGRVQYSSKASAASATLSVLVLLITTISFQIL